MTDMGWVPTLPQTNPFVTAGTPNFIAGRFEERQRLTDWVHRSERSPLLLAGVRGAGKTTLSTWLSDYVAFDPHGHFADGTAPIPVAARGNRADSILDQLTRGSETTVTSELSGGVLGVRGSWAESTTGPRARSLLDLIPSGHVIIIDEAQSLSREQLGEIAEFLETPGSEFSGKVLMVGTPELFYIHPKDGTFGLFGRCQRVPLAATQSLAETADTVVGTVALTGGRKHFSEAAIERVHSLTGGYPTAVQIACYYAYDAAGDVIEADHVDLSPGSPAQRQLANAFDQMIRRQGSRGRHPKLRNEVLRVLAHGPATSGEIAQATDKANAKGVSPALEYLRRSGLVDLGADHAWRITVPMLDQHVLNEPRHQSIGQRGLSPLQHRRASTVER